MRLDRFITLNLMQPLRRTYRASRITSLPVLMFHSISDDPESGIRPYYRVCTSPQRFREQMQWLKDNSYQGVTLSDGLEWLNSGVRIADYGPRTEKLRPVAITFDDGFQDFYSEAVPVLKEFGFSATMYLPTACITSHSMSPDSCDGFKGRRCLSWAEVKELHRTGIEFGSHTVHHAKLADLPRPEIKIEIADSKTQIENQLGAPVKTFAYPYAFPQARREFVASFKGLLTEAGYETCVTTQIGRHWPHNDHLQINRLPVNSTDDSRFLQAKLEGGYDWAELPQLMVKQIKGRILSSGKGTGTHVTSQPAGFSEPFTNSK